MSLEELSISMFEIVGWLVAYLVITEIIFIFLSREDVDYEKDFDYDIHGGLSWFPTKILSLMSSGVIMLIQFFVLFPKSSEQSTMQYSRLIPEFSIIVGIGLFFLANKYVYEKILYKGKQNEPEEEDEE